MPKEFEKMAKAIKENGGADNPFAVARSKLGTDAQIMARRKGKGAAPGKGKKKVGRYG